MVADYDRYVRTNDGPVHLRIEPSGDEFQGKINRHINQNGTARILGGAKLRDWFQKNFEPMDIVHVDLGSYDLIVLKKP